MAGAVELDDLWGRFQAYSSNDSMMILSAVWIFKNLGKILTDLILRCTQKTENLLSDVAQVRTLFFLTITFQLTFIHIVWKNLLKIIWFCSSNYFEPFLKLIEAPEVLWMNRSYWFIQIKLSFELFWSFP